jgi:hypothetical protein
LNRSQTAAELVAAYALLLALVWQVAPRHASALGIALAAVLVASWWRRGATLASLGLSPRTWRSGWRTMLLVSLAGVAALAAIGIALGSASLAGDRFEWLGDYALGIVGQQILLQGLYAPGFDALVRPGRRHDAKAIAGATLAFAGLHVPNPWLVVGTLVAGAFWVVHFRRHRNLPAVLASHLLLGAAAMASLGPGPLWNLRVGAGALEWMLER